MKTHLHLVISLRLTMVSVWERLSPQFLCLPFLLFLTPSARHCEFSQGLLLPRAGRIKNLPAPEEFL